MRAEDLRKDKGSLVTQQQRLFDSELSQCFHRIQRVHEKSNCEYTFYTIPLAVSGEPIYDWKGCVDFVKNNLRDNGFSVRVHRDMRTLFISWDKEGKKTRPSAREKDNDMDGSMEERRGENQKEMDFQESRKDPRDSGEELVINFNPKDPLSHLNLRAQLMAANGKFAHLKNVQGLKRK
jgi:uncharacterized protein DUF5759